MTVLVPVRVAERLVLALRSAGSREVGGVLMGEHLGEDRFRVVDLTIQTSGGTFASFVRLVEGVVGPLQAFFARTKRNFRRFNYLGEWHSHHSFSLVPSEKDNRTMFEIVDDREVGAHFAVLLLSRLGVGDELETALYVYSPGGERHTGLVVSEED